MEPMSHTQKLLCMSPLVLKTLVGVMGVMELNVESPVHLHAILSPTSAVPVHPVQAERLDLPVTWGQHTTPSKWAAEP